MGKLYGIGVGPGDPDLITVKAKNVLEEVDVVFYPASEKTPRALGAVLPYIANKETIALEFPMAGLDKTSLSLLWLKNAKLIKEILEEKDAAFVVLGDPYLYSTYSYLVELLKSYGIELITIPGISAPSALASLLDIPLAQDEETVALFPMTKNPEDLRQTLRDNENIVVLKVSADPKSLYDELKRSESDFDFYMVSDVFGKNQAVTTDVERLLDKVPYMSTVLLKRKD